MSDDKNKTYLECKEELRKSFHKVTDHSSYVNRTYDGVGFAEALLDFENCWFSLLKTLERSKDKDSYYYKLDNWLYWDHNFNKCLYRVFDGEEFLYPEFLDSLFDLTYRFLHSKNQEEESQVLNDGIYLERKGDEYVFKKRLWITEDSIDLKSDLLPGYFFKEVSDPKKSKKYYDECKERWSKWCLPEWMDEMLSIEKETWKIYRKAIKAGVIKEIKTENR